MGQSGPIQGTGPFARRGRVVFGAAVLALSLAAFTGATARAYTPTVTESGVPVRWKGGRVKLDLAGNPQNQSGVAAGDFQASVVRSLRRWEGASSGAIQFDYWQGTDSSKFVPASEYDGLSAIYFASNARSDPHLTSNVLGLTQVWYDTTSGQILETDIVLNDKNFRFTTSASDTSGYGLGSSMALSQSNKVFIENVITHELGHAFGLSHSGGLQSTMLFMESPEQAHLGCDEAAAVRAVYPASGAGAVGAISGTVVSEQGAPIFGAHVLAISRRRGTVMASALSAKDGTYTISGLEPGAYFLMVEPFYAGSSTLPAYFSAARSDVCPGGRSFGRTPLTDAGGTNLTAVTVKSGGTTATGRFVAQCTGGSGAAIQASVTSAGLGTAPQVFAGGSGGFGVVDRFSYSTSVYYKLRAVSGHLDLHGVSFSLYSPAKTTLELIDSRGMQVMAADAEDYVYRGDSGFVNYDSRLVADNLPMDDYTVRVSYSTLGASYYPAGPVSLDSVPFVVLTGSVNEAEPALESQIPFNSRCRQDENFATYVSPAGDPPRHMQGQGSVGFCGRVEAAGQGKGPGGRMGGGGTPGAGGGAGAVAGWFLPYLVMGAGGLWIRRRFRRGWT